MRFLLLLYFCCFLLFYLSAQENVGQQFVVKRQRVIDYEKLFTTGQVERLEDIINTCWNKGIADIAIVTIDDGHTDVENFEKYVRDNLTSYALGEYGKDNGMVIAISKKLRKMRVENARGIVSLLSDQVTKSIVDEKFIPRFKEGQYYEGTLEGLEAIVGHLERKIQKADFELASAIFKPSDFERVRTFVFENGSRHFFQYLDRECPSYFFTTLDVFLASSRDTANLRKGLREDDFDVMTIKDSDGEEYRFVYFAKDTMGSTSVLDGMQAEHVYWLNPGDKMLSQHVWPLLTQIDDEILQNDKVNNAKSFTSYRWILRQEFDPEHEIYIDLRSVDTMSFVGDDLFINQERVGAISLNSQKRNLSIRIDEKDRSSFMVYKLDGRYNFHYLFNKVEDMLYLVPLDEKEDGDLISVEGRRLRFEALMD